MQEPEGGEGSAGLGRGWRGVGARKHIWHLRNPADSHNLTREMYRPYKRKSAVFPFAITEAAEVTPTRLCANQPPKFKKRVIKQETGGEREKKTKQFSIWWDITSKLVAIVRFATLAKNKGGLAAGRGLFKGTSERKYPKTMPLLIWHSGAVVYVAGSIDRKRVKEKLQKEDEHRRAGVQSEVLCGCTLLHGVF